MIADIHREHCQTFLRMLTEAAAQGQPVLTSQLAAISRNHTARISNLRAEGHDIVCESVPEHLRAPGNGRQTQYRYRGLTDKATNELLGVPKDGSLMPHRLMLSQCRNDEIIDTVVLRPFACASGVSMRMETALTLQAGDDLQIERVA